MRLPTDRASRGVPPSALAISLVALVVPVVGALAFPEALGQFGALLWLLALVPAFLLAYHRGWEGVATSLAAGMATLSFTQALALWMGQNVPDLLLAVVVSYLAIALGIGWMAENLHREKDEVEDLAFTDSLTNLPNRRHAEVFLENEFAAARRGRLLAVVLFDLDGFKAYNDTYGHQAGDQALSAFADILSHTTRRMNLSARFGGEEFIAVLAGSDADGAVAFAERVRTSLRAQDIGDPPLTVSAGVSPYRPSVAAPLDLVAEADEALYEAKRGGRDCVRLFDATGPAAPEPQGDRASADRTAVETPAAAALAVEGRVAVEPRPEAPAAGGFGVNRRILLVEGDAQVRGLIRRYLESEGFVVEEAGDVQGGIHCLGADFDVVMTDIHLPGASGYELVTVAKSRWPETQVIVVTGLQGARVAARALDAPADRYLFKPFGMPELRGHLEDALAQRDRSLLERAPRDPVTPEERERARRARAVALRGALALVGAAEVRDPFTVGHSARVAEYALAVAREVDRDEALFDPDSLRIGCELHDVGKIGVSDGVLNKEGPLDETERLEVQRHPEEGRRILRPLLEDEVALAVVRWHHEHWNGEGYPDGLSGEAIPLAARLVALVDAFDAMTSDRSYRPAKPWDAAAEEVESLSGTQFDPELVRAFQRALPELRRIRDAEFDEGTES
jgi:diguanylate cyclase (GGDEF)-like protein